MKLNILNSLVILSLFFIGCGGGNSSSKDEDINITDVNLTNEDMNFTIIKSGYIDINESIEKKFQLIYDQEKFDEVYKTFDGNSTPQIDFKKNQVLLLMLGDKPSKDYSVKVIKIKEENDYTRVFIETSILNETCIKDKEQVLPYTIINIPKVRYKEVLFEESIKVLECSESNLDETFETISFREIDLLTISAEVSYEVDQTFQIIQNSKIFEDIYYNHINPIGLNKELPYIDFENETLIALFMNKNAIGPDIKVTSIKEYDNYIEIETQRYIISRYCPTLDAISAPVTFVTIPKTDKEIIFKEYANIELCEEYAIE